MFGTLISGLQPILGLATYKNLDVCFFGKPIYKGY